MSTVPRGVVRVTAPGDLGVLNLADIVLRFSRKYPLVHIELSLSSRFPPPCVWRRKTRGKTRIREAVFPVWTGEE